MNSDRDKLESILGHTFQNPDLLELALTHRSASREHNERLEFMGDAILDMVISERLFNQYPEATEGELSRMRANLVNGEVLAEIAVEIELGQYVKLGAGERKSGGKRRGSILANMIEALIAAVYLDGGLGNAELTIDKLFVSRLVDREIDKPRKDSKTRLQELMQSRGLPLPHYTVLQITGEAHDQTFSVQCEVELLSHPKTGAGKSKRIAEQDAAEQVIIQLEETP